MTPTTRGSARWTIPWAALVVVAIFAFMQLKAAQRARGELAKARDDARAEEHVDLLQSISRIGTPGSGVHPEIRHPEISDRERALDDALAREQAGHREATARLRQVEEQLAAERARADRNAALRATESARADALERHRAEVAGNLARTKALLEKGASLVEAQPVQRWLEDAGSGDKTRVAYARACAAKATPEQIEALRALVRDAPVERLSALARLASELPEGPVEVAFIGDLVMALPEAGLSRHLDSIMPPDRLAPVPVFVRVLEGGSNALRLQFLTRGIMHRVNTDEEERRTLTAAMLRLLDADDPEACALAARGMTLLRLPGGAERLAALLKHESPVVRAGAAYGLTGIPDRGAVAAEARAAIPDLLADADFEVRVSGMLLAEALLGGRVDYHPNAKPDVRAKAIEKIKARLGS